LSFHPLEHELIKIIKRIYGFEERSYWLSCSGGLDSVVLFHLLKAIQPVFKFKLKVFYVHHGWSEIEKTQSDYRERALNFVKALCEKYTIKFKFFKSSVFLKNEEECRAFRLQSYEKIFFDKSRIFLAHHQDDLFETLLIRLIRGTGAEGFKEPFSRHLERPLVYLCGRNKLEGYQKEKQVEFVSDPSNEERAFLRNWLRKDWLPQLENTPHGLNSFKSSLIKLSEHLSQTESDFDNFLNFEQKNEGYFKLSDFMIFNQVQKRPLYLMLFISLKVRYTAGQFWRS